MSGDDFIFIYMLVVLPILCVLFSIAYVALYVKEQMKKREKRAKEEEENRRWKQYEEARSEYLLKLLKYDKEAYWEEWEKDCQRQREWYETVRSPYIFHSTYIL